MLPRFNIKNLLTGWSMLTKVKGTPLAEGLMATQLKDLNPALLKAAAGGMGIQISDQIFAVVMKIAAEEPELTLRALLTRPDLPDLAMKLMSDMDAHVEAEELLVFSVPHTCPGCGLRHYVRVREDFCGQNNHVATIKVGDLPQPVDPFLMTRLGTHPKQT